MTWFTEDPWPILFAGIAIEAILAVALFQTQRGILLLAMLGTALVTGGLLLVERMIVTETEQVEMVLYELESALPRDDQATILDQLSPNAPAVRLKAQAALALFRVTQANIGSDLKITINELTSPRSARASFLARLDVESRRGGFRQTALRRFTLLLNEEGDRWYITHFEHEAP